jgi:hypothetical protein
MRVLRAIAIGTTATGLLLTTAACGSETKEQRSQEAIEEALETAAAMSGEADSAAFRATMTLKAEGDEVGIHYTGSAGWEPLRMDVSTDMSELLEAQGQSGGPSGLDMRFIDGVLYMGGSILEPDLDGMKWVRLDTEGTDAELDPELAMLHGQLDQLNDVAQNPAEQIAVLLGAKEIEWRGGETMDGVRTDRYDGELTVDEALEADPAMAKMAPAEVEEMRDELESAGAERFVYTVWIDENDLPIRIDWSIEMAQLDMHYSTRYEDYGVEVEVAVPPAGETVDATEVDGSLFA